MSLVQEAARQLDRQDAIANRLLSANNINFDDYLHEAEEGAKVKSPVGYADELKKFLSGEDDSGIHLPWKKTHGLVRLREAELSIWAGINGHGKSMLLNQIMLGGLEQGAKICIASMEMKPIQTLARMSRQGIGVEHPTDKYVDHFLQEIDGMYLYDQQGTVKSNRMMAVIRYCQKELGVSHFVIDSLMKCGFGVDEYNKQKFFIDELSTFAKDSGIHIHLVAHMRKGDDERKASGKFDIKGAGEISDMADNVFIIRRNKSKEAQVKKAELAEDHGELEKLMEFPDTFLACEKQRNGEWEDTIGLWFNQKALQFVGKRTTQAIDHIGRISAAKQSRKNTGLIANNA